MEPFKAIVVQKQGDDIVFPLETIPLEQLSQGEVIIKVAYSSVNYKDSLAVKPKGGVIRSYPMIPGIDLSGTVVSSQDPKFTPGQKVLVTGFKVGMSHTGGFSEYARIPAAWVVPLPEGLTLRDAMIIGTAGFTAALSVAALERAGMAPKHNPSILVTGASGGVGSIAIQLLSRNGYKDIHALTRKEYELDKLKALGASNVSLNSQVIPEQSKPLEKERFDFILDTVGDEVAAALIPQVHYGGSISMCGNAAGIKLNTTVLPFILRGINILGIDSVELPMAPRLPIWARFGKDWAVAKDAIVHEVTLEGLPAVFASLQKGAHVGRTIVKIGG